MLRRVVQEEVGRAPSHKVKCATNFETITISLGTPYVVFHMGNDMDIHEVLACN